MTLDFSRRYSEIFAPMTAPVGVNFISRYFPKRLELSLIAVHALPNASTSGFTCRIFSRSVRLLACKQRSYEDNAAHRIDILMQDIINHVSLKNDFRKKNIFGYLYFGYLWLPHKKWWFNCTTFVIDIQSLISIIYYYIIRSYNFNIIICLYMWTCVWERSFLIES